MHCSAYTNLWEIQSTEEYDKWFAALDEESKTAVLERVLLLQKLGPILPRPYSDVLHGSKYTNLKELRNKTTEHVLRVAYYFDPKRKAVLLTGGDKKGLNEKKFYKDLIKEAELLIEKHEKELEESK